MICRFCTLRHIFSWFALHILAFCAVKWAGVNQTIRRKVSSGVFYRREAARTRYEACPGSPSLSKFEFRRFLFYHRRNWLRRYTDDREHQGLFVWKWKTCFKHTRSWGDMNVEHACSLQRLQSLLHLSVVVALIRSVSTYVVMQSFCRGHDNAAKPTRSTAVVCQVFGRRDHQFVWKLLV